MSPDEVAKKYKGLDRSIAILLDPSQYVVGYIIYLISRYFNEPSF
jgi:hypothetical protein